MIIITAIIATTVSTITKRNNNSSNYYYRVIMTSSSISTDKMPYPLPYRPYDGLQISIFLLVLVLLVVFLI